MWPEARRLAILGLAVLTVAASNVSAQEFDRLIGTWVLNVSATQWGTSTPPQSQIRTFDYTHDGLIVCTFRNVSADGERVFIHWFTRLDGQHIAEFIRGSGISPSTMAVKKIDDSTITIEGKSLDDGRLLFTGRATVSEDGKTLTWTIKNFYDEGRENITVRRYEKEEVVTP